MIAPPPPSRRLIRDIAGGWPVPDRPLKRRVMASPPTPTLGASATISSPRTIYPGFTNSFYNGSQFTYSRAGSGLLGPSEPERRTLQFRNVSYGADGLTKQSNGYMVSFWHTGQELEIVTSRVAQAMMLRVDGEYVSLTPQAGGSSTGADQFWYFDFGSVDRRRIDFLSSHNNDWRGLRIAQTGDVVPAQLRGPRVLIIGDSGPEGGGPVNIGSIFADAMGWDDVWTSAVGTTGWVNAGSHTTIPARFAADVIPYAPDIIINLGGLNDNATVASAAAMKVAVAAGLATLRAALPNCLHVNMGPWANGGPGRAPAAIYTRVLAGLRDAYLEAGGLHLPLVELPLPEGYAQPTITTLASAALDATTVRIDVNTIGEHTLAPIDSEDRFYIKTISASPSTWTATIDGTLKVAIANGKQLRVVGPSLWSGSGYVGATTGFGNSDILVDSDSTHPTTFGRRVIGEVMAGLMIRALRQLQREALAA